MVIGIGLSAFEIYTMIISETEISIGDLSLVKAQDNTNSYITIALGIVAIGIRLIKGEK